MKKGILKQVDYSEWATSIVTKSNGSIRIYGDYKATESIHSENDI